MSAFFIFIFDVITIVIAIGVLTVAITFLYTYLKGDDFRVFQDNLKKVKNYSLRLLQRGENVAINSGEYTKISMELLSKEKEYKTKMTSIGEYVYNKKAKYEFPKEVQDIIKEALGLEKEIKKLEKQRKGIGEKILKEKS